MKLGNMMQVEELSLDKTKGILEAIHGHPDATAATRLAAAMALDYLDAGSTEKALAVINGHLLP